jgi:hypothetical protein
MNERKYLLCSVVGQVGDRYRVRSKLVDGSNFEIVVPKSKLTLIDPGSAWLFVESTGQRDNSVSITLPSPILDKGYRVSVSPTSISRNPIVSKPESKPKSIAPKPPAKKRKKKI